MLELLADDQHLRTAVTAAAWIAIADIVLVSGLLAAYVLRTVRRWTRLDE